MAKKSTKKTEDKELKLKEVKKEDLVEIPNTKEVKIVFLQNGREYTKSREVAKILIEKGLAKLA